MSEITREEWEAGYTIALIWGCGDDECECHQPVIQRVEPNRVHGYPWVRRHTLWEGTFTSFGGNGYDDPSYDDLLAELHEAMKDYPEAREI